MADVAETQQFEAIRYAADGHEVERDPGNPAMSDGAVLCTGTLHECRCAVEEALRDHQQELMVRWAEDIQPGMGGLLAIIQEQVESGRAPENAAPLAEGIRGYVWLRPREAEDLMAWVRSLPRWREGRIVVLDQTQVTIPPHNLRWSGLSEEGDVEAYHEGLWQGCGGWAIRPAP